MIWNSCQQIAYEGCSYYWDSVILHDSTHHLYFSLHVNYQLYGYTRLTAESITWRYAEQSDVANFMSADYNGINASILLNIHTIQSNALHMTLNPLIIYICSVNILCLDATTMLFRSAIPAQSGGHHVVNSTHSTSNFPWLQYVFQSFLSLVGRGIFWKPSVPSID